MHQYFKEFLSRYQTKGKLLLAVSGGMDSMVLTHLCKSSGHPFVILHVNFNLRGEESARDEAFVREAASNYGAEIMVLHPDTELFAREHKVSIQEAARTIRYQWFHEVKNAQQAQYILTAHHADDNVETIIFNFFRGTGLKGLTGIPENNDGVLRPLLAFRKADLGKYAVDNHIKWVADSSNETLKYTRNFIRNSLMPQLKILFPEVETNLLKSASRFRDINDFFQLHASQQLKGVVEGREDEKKISILKLEKLPQVLWHDIFHPFGFSAAHFEQIKNLCKGVSGKFIENAKWRLIRHHKWLLIASHENKSTVHIIQENTEGIRFEEGELKFSSKPFAGEMPNGAPGEVMIDMRVVQYPLVLRKWKAGDYFYPFGMKKKKKVARFLIDSKRSKVDKEKTWVLESDRKILWIVGQRLDERCRVGGGTTSCLKITYQNEV